MSETPDKDRPGCPMCARLQRYADTAWNRGHTMGMKANEDAARQAMDALRTEKEAHADTNARLTEDNMRLEAERDEAREALREYLEARKAPFPLYISGPEAQQAWGERIGKAEARARAILAKVKP